MTEIKEVLRLWLARTGKKRIAAQLGIDVKTVRRYARAAVAVGLRPADALGRWADCSDLSNSVDSALRHGVSMGMLAVPSRDHCGPETEALRTLEPLGELHCQVLF